MLMSPGKKDQNVLGSYFDYLLLVPVSSTELTLHSFHSKYESEKLSLQKKQKQKRIGLLIQSGRLFLFLRFTKRKKNGSVCIFFSSSLV